MMVQSKKRKAKGKSVSRASQKNPDEQRASGQKRSFEIESVNQTCERIVDEVEDYAIIMLDPMGKILTWNKGAEKINGYAPQEIIGKNYRIFYTREEKASKLPEALLTKTRQGGKSSYEGWWIKKDGSRFWGNMSLTALHNEDGSLRGYLKVTRDLTDRKAAEDRYGVFVEELRLKNEELRKSEDRYHKMVSEVVDYAIILLDKEGKVLDWNKGAQKLKGYSANEIVGKSFKLFYPKEEREKKVPERLLAEAAKKGSVTHEGWRIKKDGTRFWGMITITSLHDDTRKIMGFTKVTRDLTEKKIAEERVSNILEELRQANEYLKESEIRYHRMVEEVQDYAIIFLDPKGNIQNWNAGAQVIKGYKAKEIIGKTFKMFYTKADRDAKLPDRLLSEAVKEGKTSHEGWRVHKDGSLFWGSVVITAIHNEKGDLIGFSKVTRDLTERKIAEDTLKATAAQLDLKNRALERVNDELSSFSHIASHDLKEPLRKIQLYAERIYGNGVPEGSMELFHKLKGTAVKMQRLIDDLLSYSRVSNDSSAFEEVDLNAVLESVINDMEASIAEKKAVVKAQRLPVVHAISFHMHQLFLNLISNAIKFSKAGFQPVIDINCEIIKGPYIPENESSGANNYYHIAVRDNGIGFQHQDKDRIFNAFQRLHSKEDYAGSGVGLAIVKKIVDRHNGIISAEGKPGEGSIFHIYLPIYSEK